LRKFRFDRPQQFAALLLLGLLLQCLFVIQRAPLTDTDYQYARCGREMWEKPSPIAGYFTSCGNIHDGTLAYRAAGLPLTLQRIVLGQGADTSTWEMRHELSAVRLLLRIPFTLIALILGAALWWVTRRLYGNAGGYIALGLYCFSPLVVDAATAPSSEILTTLGLFAAIYTGMGVAHAMHGPRRKWRPRIILLTLAFGMVAASHVVAILPMIARHCRSFCCFAVPACSSWSSLRTHSIRMRSPTISGAVQDASRSLSMPQSSCSDHCPMPV
jgi:hypothetical protein